MRQNNIIWVNYFVLVKLAEKETHITTFVYRCLKNAKRIILDWWSIILLDIAFIGFVVWNGGIVLGDKEKH